MPPKFGGGIKCGRCDKSVYAAEEVKAIGKSWHKMCFKCATCNKMLDSTTVADKDGQIFCKTCYAKQFGPKGYGVGQGAGILQMYDAPPTTDVPLQTSAPEARESTSNTDEASMEGPSATAAEANEVSVSSPFRARSGSTSSMDKSNTAAVDKDMCARCSKRVYFAEKTIGAGRTWHKACFRCTGCNKNLDSFATEKDGALYCKGTPWRSVAEDGVSNPTTPAACYAKNFGPKGVGFGGALQYTE